ncbi:hypothetical protein FQA39_LY18345 [Lamprigera yunnana]|nr:hypothetical protein FQA39_LY18345 [Lamprigera yunnana]
MPNELLPRHVQNLIECFLEENGVQNYTYDVTPATSEGANYVATILRIIVKGDDYALSLIVKLAPDKPLVRSILPVQIFYKQETYFYTRIFPELERFQDEHGVAEQFRAYPKYYRSSLEEFKELLLLKDMKELGFVLRSSLEPLDYSHSFLIVKEYAKLHGVSFAMRKLKPELFEELSRNTGDQIFQQLVMGELKKKNLNERCDIALRCLDPVEHKEAYEKFSTFSEVMFEDVQVAVRAESAGKYSVFTHSDGWVNNYLFKYKDEDMLEEVCILDWQLSRTGSPALDLSYFLFCCTDQDFRQKYYDELLQTYYKTLCSILTEFHCDPEELFPFEVLLEHLRKFSLYGLYMATLVLNLTLLQGGEIPTLVNFSKEADIHVLRHASNSDDYKRYSNRMRGVILDFVNFGYNF